jgi:hypothetical protein
MYRHNEKKDSRLAARVVPETEDSRDGLKFGLADPMRKNRAMVCGNQAKLLAVSYVLSPFHESVRYTHRS